MRLEATLDHISARKVKISFTWLKYAGLVSICVAVFFPTFYNGFQLEWDDQWMLINHELVLNPTWGNIWYYLTHYVDGQYFPLNQLYYLGLFEWFGFNPTVYHLGSLLIHSCNVVMVYFLVWALISQLDSGHEGCNFLALGTALLFAIHPLQVEAVAWISASKVLWYGFFTLGSLLLYLFYLRSGKRRYLFLVFLGYGLGFMCKEQMIILPLLLVLFDLFVSRGEINRKRLWLEKIPFFAFALILWYGASQSGLGVTEVGGYSLDQRLALGSYCFNVYVFRFLAPVGLLHFYDYPIRAGESLPLIYYAYIVLVLFVGYGAWELFRGRSKLLLFALLFFIINLVLVLHIIPSPRTYMAADRYMYLPIIGLGMTMMWLLSKLSTKLKYDKGVKYALVCVGLILLGIQSHRMTRDWMDSVVLKEEIVEHLNKKVADGK